MAERHQARAQRSRTELRPARGHRLTATRLWVKKIATQDGIGIPAVVAGDEERPGLSDSHSSLRVHPQVPGKGQMTVDELRERIAAETAGQTLEETAPAREALREAQVHLSWEKLRAVPFIPSFFFSSQS